MKKYLPFLAMCLLMSACGQPSGSPEPDKPYDKGRTFDTPPDTVKVGTPYEIFGKTYYPRHDPAYDETGVASWYGPGFHGKQTANGEIFDENALTAAHTTLPMPCFVRVTNLDNGKSIVVRVNDRGPFKDDRIIDLSRGTAE